MKTGKLIKVENALMTVSSQEKIAVSEVGRGRVKMHPWGRSGARHCPSPGLGHSLRMAPARSSSQGSDLYFATLTMEAFPPIMMQH